MLLRQAAADLLVRSGHHLKMSIDQGYKDHSVFSQLAEYADFYKNLSMSIFGFVTMGTKAACNIDSYVYS